MRHNPLQSLTVLSAMLAFTAAASPAPLKLFGRDALVGKWKVTVTADDGSKETTDNITFKGGKFTSENEEKDGFEAATYEDKPAPAGMSAQFEVTLTNKAGDTAKWSGFSTGAELSGTLVVTRKDGTVINYTIKASKTP